MKKLSFPALLVAFLFTLILDTISCTKEYSHEGKPMAVYNLTDLEAGCTDAVVNGNYIAGVPLDSSHYVYITANVTKAGDYTIQTNVINGISFMAAGNFPNTGSHTVILKATGNPDSTGVFKLNIVGDNSCFFSVEVVSDQLAEYVLLGSPGNCETFDIEGLYILNKEMDTSNIVTVSVEVLSRGNYALTTDTLAGIFFSATGFFNTTGKQTIRLMAAGTVRSSGLFYFKVLGNGLPCDFKIPIQNAEPLAIYALVSLFASVNPCILKSVNGDYITTVPLSANNTIELFVFVFQTGNFTISTDRINGIIFTNTGKFDRVGEQTVTLSGNGTPINSGVFSFIPQIIGPAPIGGYRCNINLAIR